MKKMFTPLVVILFLLVSSKGFSQIVWTFNDSMATPAVNSYPDITASAMTSNNNTIPMSGVIPTAITQTSKSTGYTNYSGTFNIGAAADTSLTRGLNSASAYFEFTLTPSLTTNITISSIRFGSRSTGTGPRAVAISTSLDAYLTNVALDTLTSNSVWIAKDFTGLSIPIAAGVPVTIRIYGYNGAGNVSAGNVNWRIDDITLNNATVLPVTLNSFTASVVSNKVVLNWTTANEVNMKGFSVEKSNNAKNFSEVNYVAASGKGTYSTEDAVSNSISYYRLKMINQDGSFSYSKNIVVNAGTLSSAALHVYPNPVSSSAVISHPLAGANATLRITDFNGRVLQTYSLQQNAVQTTINVSKLMSGTYMLVYRDADGKTVSTRIIKN